VIAVFVVCGVLAIALTVLWTRYRRLRREHYIRDFALPKGLYERLRKRRPELEQKDCALVARGLRQFFLAYLNSGGKFVSMPSQVVDDLWHEFILYTKAYDDFCKQAFGRFLHHTPAVVLGPQKRDNEGLRRVWCTPARRRTSTRARPRACPCCSPSTPSSASATASSMRPTARRRARTAAAMSIAVRTSTTVRWMAAPMVLAMAMVGVVVGTAEVMEEVVVGAGATERLRKVHFDLRSSPRRRPGSSSFI
jgi:hypothetical protein